MPQWIMRHGKYFSECHNCCHEVEGSEEPGGGPNGRRDTVIFFRCPCGSRWHKKKHVFLSAVRGGYEGGLGNWIKCDESGFVTPEARMKIQNDVLGYGAVQVAKNLYFLRGVTSAEIEKTNTDKKFVVALRALEKGKSEEEAQKEVATYLRDLIFEKNRKSDARRG
ncbi:MAG: hypothetical protein G01um101448_845 [Parcubacteria group bacterium Gr01-1014_48]|nr:MAG: hypothetical protein Greene041614_225 [Parcubacteria group bacterium Greene0416_14]TSC73255.1 MAG: hypothetical protein G01um101448_845 [Parcubacteria group bacterium Gr01-1014_48]TSD01132.1 MAG: hypothetical protein Greene101415_435 [Parcubacteria group bacterium Greene1014_15]TSD08208.1 MAG: hypothetical protein Greene07144_278 [Parcubacteria group bacterium Greene0714_4]